MKKLSLIFMIIIISVVIFTGCDAFKEGVEDGFNEDEEEENSRIFEDIGLEYAYNIELQGNKLKS